MYEVALEEMWELFSPYLDGARTGVVCVASAARLGDAARSALENSAAALGYGRACCTYVALRSESAAGKAPGTEESGTDKERAADHEVAVEAELDGQALFLLLEGLDPLVVVAADAEAARALGAAYRQEVPSTAPAACSGETPCRSSRSSICWTTRRASRPPGLCSRSCRGTVSASYALTTASAASSSARTSSTVSASAYTRTSGSVPEGRIITQASPSR